MIKSITLNNCKPYNEAIFSDCKKINFIYGSNGSGKTTISTFLENELSARFSESSIEWDSEKHETICVYNRNFRRNNIQQSIPGVFTLGSATIEDIKELELMKTNYEREKESWARLDISYKKYVNTLIPNREE